jgi:hypothetical protein
MIEGHENETNSDQTMPGTKYQRSQGPGRAEQAQSLSPCSGSCKGNNIAQKHQNSRTGETP